MTPQCIKPTVKHRGGKIHVWGCFASPELENSTGSAAPLEASKLYWQYEKNKADQEALTLNDFSTQSLQPYLTCNNRESQEFLT